MEGVNDLLRAPHRERGNDHLPLPLDGFENESADLRPGIDSLAMVPSAIGAFHLKDIHVLHGLRITQNIIIAAAYVPAKKIANLPASFANIEHHLRRTQNMPGIVKGHRHPVRNEDGPVVT